MCNLSVKLARSSLGEHLACLVDLEIVFQRRVLVVAQILGEISQELLFKAGHVNGHLPRRGEVETHAEVVMYLPLCDAEVAVWYSSHAGT